MSETKTQSAYERVCAERCRWCSALWRIDRKSRCHIHPDGDRWNLKYACTAPSELQLIEELSALSPDPREARIKRLETALREARCWIVDGSRGTPEQRGATCDVANDVFELIDAALEPAPEGEENAIPVLEPATPEMLEQRESTAWWQKQFEILQTRVVELGYEFYYDAEGKPAVRGKDAGPTDTERMRASEDRG